jgi:alpha-1,2-glucosyltransferase
MPQPNKASDPSAILNPCAGNGMGVFAPGNPETSGQARRKRVAFWSLLVAGYTLCALYSAHIGVMRLDEPDHYEQVERFRHGVFHPLVDTLTTIPGYHLLLAALLALFGVDTFSAARVVSSLFGVLAVAGFHNLRRDATGRDDYLATAQFAVLPIFLLFVFMVQTDAASLALLLWATWAAGRGRHWAAGLFLFAAECVRQNNVLWLVLLAWPLVQTVWQRRSVQSAMRTLPDLLPYVIAGGAFVAYWVVHGSVVLARNQASAHPDFSLHSGNLFYLMFLGAVLFAIPCAQSWQRFVSDVRVRPWLIFLPLFLLAFYLGTFRVDHPFNLLQPPDLRDWLLMRTQTSGWWHWAFGVVATFGGVGLLRQRLTIPHKAIFWTVTALFVSLSWLIEQRYYLAPYALFMAWRTPQSEVGERVTLALWAPLAVLLFWGMMTGQLYI